MKQIILTFVSVFLGFTFAQATTLEAPTYRGYSGNSYIFVEGGVEFSVFPDGQFDFVYLGNQTNVTISTPNVNLSYNTGYDYDTYVQYDMYGAVIQVENVPIYYDAYGRITQAGSVQIRYHNHRIVQVGGLTIFYNPRGYFSHYVGYINPYNRFYVYRPWHLYYAVPYYCVVYTHPYRRYYTPRRYAYSYHRTHRGNTSYVNGRRTFYRPGSRIHYQDGRTASNPSYRGDERGNNNATYTRNDRELTRFASRTDQQRNRTSTRTDQSATNRNTANRNTVKKEPQTGQRTAVQQRQATRTDNKPQVVQRNTRANKPATQVRNNNTRVSNNKAKTVRKTNTNNRNHSTARRASNTNKRSAGATRGRG